MPVLVPLLIPFFAFAAALVIIGLAQTHTAAHGSSSSSGFWQFLSSGLLKTLFGQIAKAGRFIVSHFAAAQLGLFAKWLVGIGTLTAGWFGISAAFSEAITYAVERVENLVHREVKTLTRSTTHLRRELTREIHAAEHETAHVAHNLRRFEAKVAREVHPLTHAIDVTIPRELGRAHREEEALARDLGKLKERTRSLEDGALDTWKWIRSHPLTAATGAFAAAVAIALQRIGLGNLRCKNFTNVLRHYGCGFGTLLARLLPLAILLSISFDFRDFCKGAEVVASGIGDAVAGIEGVFEFSLPPLPPPGR